MTSSTSSRAARLVAAAATVAVLAGCGPAGSAPVAQKAVAAGKNPAAPSSPGLPRPAPGTPAAASPTPAPAAPGTAVQAAAPVLRHSPTVTPVPAPVPPPAPAPAAGPSTGGPVTAPPVAPTPVVSPPPPSPIVVIDPAPVPGPPTPPPPPTPPTSGSDAFTDIAGCSARTAINALAGAGIVTGGGAFHPTAAVTRADFAATLARGLHLDVSSPVTGPAFTDVPASFYAYPDIEAVAKAGLMHGTASGQFAPMADVPRQEMAADLDRALQTTGAGSPTPLTADAYTDIAGSYARDAINDLVARDVLPGGGSFHPSDVLTRQDLAVVLVQALHIPTDPTPTDPTPTDPTPTDPAPTDPTPTDPTPTDPTPTGPGTGDPGSGPIVVPPAPLPLDLSGIDAQLFDRDAIAELVASGVLTGSGDGTYEPAGNISRVDFAIVLARALQLQAPAGRSFSDVDVTAWSTSAVDAAIRAGLLPGAGGNSSSVFDPTAPVTSGQLTDLFGQMLAPKVIPPDPAPPVRDPLPPLVPFDPTAPAVTP